MQLPEDLENTPLKEKIEKEDWALFLCTEIGSRGYNLKKECVNDFSTLCKFVFFVYSCLVCKKGEAAHFPWDGSTVEKKIWLKLVLEEQLILFSNLSCMFLNPNIFFPIWIIIVQMYEIWEISRNKLKNIQFQKL